MNTPSRCNCPPLARRPHRWPLSGVLAAAIMMAAQAWPLAAQDPDTTLRLWAAQTGPNQVSLAWDSVPGTAEYRIYLGDPDVPGTFAQRPVSTLSAGARGGILTGIPRASKGITLVAVDTQGRVRRRRRFNAIAPAASFPPPTAPTGLTAEAPSASEVTVSWDPVPGATAYFIGRAVGGSGFRVLCALCSTESRYVDRNVVAGVPHTYTIAAIFPSGVSKRVTSNTVTPGQTTAVASTPPGATRTPSTRTPPGTPAGAATTPPPGTPAGAPTTPTTASPPGTSQPAADSLPPRVYPEMPATVPDTAPPSIGAPPSGADSIALPPADTGSCVTGRTSTARDTVDRIDVRAERIGLRTTSNPDATATGNPAPVDDAYVASPEYQEGKCRNPGVPGYPRLWDGVASTSGMTSAEQIAAWKEIGVLALEYHHILGRRPTADETRRDVAALRAGTTWKQLWRQLAHSAERDARFGYWAAAPIPDSVQAQRDFGLAVPPWTPQQCYGGVGPKCGGIPEEVNNYVYPHWYGVFHMPDNTELAYVEMGVVVGSILHDNACLRYKSGLNCNGMGAGDLVKGVGIFTAELEWSKATWNVLDNRAWRATFGPYPTDPIQRDREWYDDLRPVPARFTLMGLSFSLLTEPSLTEPYRGTETRQSLALLAPAGTSLDRTDVAFCRSGEFSSTGSAPFKAPWGICR